MNVSYVKKFGKGIEIIGYFGGNVANDKPLVLEELKVGKNAYTATKEEKKTAAEMFKHAGHM